MELEESLLADISIEEWVMEKAEDWRNHYDVNYKEKHEEYFHLWRGIWREKDKSRDSERSRIIAPALQQAVESNVAEVEEATFGRGKWFDIGDDYQDRQREDIMLLRNMLQEEFDKNKVKRAISEVILSSAIYGTGMAEIVVEEIKDMKPATRPILDGAMNSVGVEIYDRVAVKLRPILPQNFLIEPAATNIDESIGVIIDEYIPKHLVEQLQESGVYNAGDLTSTDASEELEADSTIVNDDNDDKVRVTKYYGLVPADMLDDIPEDMQDNKYIEAVVVIANGEFVLKADASPYMMQDRPVVAFQWDIIPSRFWGRGVCEKGYNSQKALDAELRARMDALALTVHPMMAVDATKLARGAKMEIKPGKTILTNGNPNESLMPFHFGSVDQITFAQGAELQRMVQQSTGAVDATGVTGGINGEATASGISMSLGAIIKRHKRTLINFHENFLIPFVEKAAYRYMQFDPDRFMAADYKFVASSSLGIIAREYEVSQLVQLLQTIPADHPVHGLLIKSVIDNMNVSNREELLAGIEKAQQPDENQQQAMQAQQQAMQAQQAYLAAQTQREQALANKANVEAELMPREIEAKYVAALSTNIKQGEGDDIEFARRVKVAELALKERDLNIKEKTASNQMIMSRENNRNAANQPK